MERHQPNNFTIFKGKILCNVYKKDTINYNLFIKRTKLSDTKLIIEHLIDDDKYKLSMINDNMNRKTTRYLNKDSLFLLKMNLINDNNSNSQYIQLSVKRSIIFKINKMKLPYSDEFIYLFYNNIDGWCSIYNINDLLYLFSEPIYNNYKEPLNKNLLIKSELVKLYQQNYKQIKSIAFNSVKMYRIYYNIFLVIC